ncbi:hypothetical protein NQ314_020523 [Rhamnusium bicolor]|uniref:Major facilitator superfamily (MFS) profile domain-containing protein n=1 Tax=Rhamnusium bicolor TaxID=1586634 RepID=A0AAV8WJW8_9CUCU|nr:hypothetical protein NQ314_020523 [Rhamnusium bicolor]
MALIVLFQVILGLLTNFSSIAPSMSLGFSAVAIPTLKNTLNADQVSWFAGMASLATPFGCFFSGPIADRFGRRTAIFAINITGFIGWMIIAMAYYVKKYQYALLLLGRLLTGLSTGLCSAPATIYMAEVSSSNLRGDSWGTISLITATLPCFGMFFALYLVPESPSWLVSKNRLQEAKTNMCKIFGSTTYPSQVESELDSLIKTKGVKNITVKKSVLQQFIRKIKYLLKPQCLRPFGLVLTYFFFQQFSGTFVIVFYAIDIVKGAGITLDPYLTIVIIGLIRMVTSVVLSIISKRFGRRPLSIISGTGMTICMLMLAVYILLDGQGQILPQFQGTLTYLPLTLLILYFFTSTLGFLPLPFALAAEVFPTKIRGTATGLLSGCGYMFNFITVKVYPDMFDKMGSHGVFFFYGGVALVGTLFIICFLPETKGKSLQEIQEYFGDRQKKSDREEEE